MLQHSMMDGRYFLFVWMGSLHKKNSLKACYSVNKTIPMAREWSDKEQDDSVSASLY